MLPLTPTKLGRYEILNEIGKGAMGVVYLARDPLIGRLVALKTFRIVYSVKDQEMEQFRLRFIREAQSAGILSHPNIVTIHDVVEQSDEGLAFIAMEYVRGTNLKMLLQGEQPLSLPFVVEVIAQVADALDYAHSYRVIHRDVKPANILITADNRVKITDFGIARMDTSNLTQEGQLLGTPNYMAPEQIQGKEVDHRADLFALGVVLYEMLTRHKPFQGENLTVVSHRIVYDHFTPPKDYVQNLPPGLEGVLSRALDKDPAKRFQKAKEMVTELRKVSGGLPGPLAGDALNETQSMVATGPLLPTPAYGGGGSSWAQAQDHGTMLTPPSVNMIPPHLPPPPPLDASSAGMGTSVTSATSAAPAATTAHTTRPTVRKGPLVVPGRTLLASSLAALALLAVAAGAFGWLWWSASRVPGRDARQDEMQRQVIDSVRTGRQALALNDPGTAAAAFRQAEALAPGKQKEHLRIARMKAERQAQENGELAGQQLRELGDHVLLAQQALVGGRFDVALAESEAALLLKPDHAGAQAIRSAAQGGLRQQEQAMKRRQQRATRTTETVTPPVTPEPAPAETAAPEEAAPQTANLRIHFQSDMPGVASIRVHVNGKSFYTGTVGEKGGILRKGKGGRADGGGDLPAGNAVIEFWVTPPGAKAEHQTRSGNFPGGSTRSLEIHLTAAGLISVSLN